MGANSIDISQYRSRIGTFSGRNLVCHNGSSSSPYGNGLKTRNLMETFIMMSYLLVMSSVTQKLLIMSGVEMNPGPFYLDKTGSKKETAANHQVATASDNLKSKQDDNSRTIMTTTSTWSPSNPKIQPPKIDATDRRQIEAQNEYKSRSTKEELDDIKRTHYKEKKKKEQSNMEPGPSGINNQGWEENIAGTSKKKSFAWDPKYALSTKNTKKNKTHSAAASSSLHANDTRSKGKNNAVKYIDPAQLSMTNQNLELKPPSSITYPSIIKTRSQHTAIQNRIDPAVKGKERNQERNLYQKVYDHCKTKFDNVFGPKNKGKRPVNPNVNMLFNDKSTPEVEKDFISILPAEITEIIMNNLSEPKDIISFALTCKYAMAMIPRVRQNIVVTDENIIKELLQSVEGRRVVCKLVCDINGNDVGDKGNSFLFYDDNVGRMTPLKFAFHCPGVAIKIQSAAEQHNLFQEILDKCPRIDEIMIKYYFVEEECLLDFNNFQICGLPKNGYISENDIRILSTKLPKVRNLTLYRSRTYFYRKDDWRINAKIQVIAPDGLAKGWSVNFELCDDRRCPGNRTPPWATTDDKFEQLIVNWESITKIGIGFTTLLTDRSIKLISKTNVGLKNICFWWMDNLTGDGLDYLGLYCKNLNSIDLRMNENITESSLKNLLHSKNIKTFSLGPLPPTGISEDGFKGIVPLLKNVEEFRLFSKYLVTDYVIESLASHCQSIQKLTLNGEQLTGEGLRKILKATGSSLKYLDLKWCYSLASNDMMSIPSFCTSLEELVLGDLYVDVGRRKYSRKCLNYLRSKIKMV